MGANPNTLMKKILLVTSSLLLTATLCPLPLANEENSDATIRITSRPYIARGMQRETVREMLGAPSAQVSADVWGYVDFKAVNAVATGTQQPAAAEKKDTLVVAFKDDRVSLIRACDSEPVRAFLAQQAQSRAAASTVAGK